MRKHEKLLLIDNYDSFTYNIVQYLGELGTETTVWRNDKFAMSDVEELAPEAIVISPGPGTPAQAGNTMEVIRRFGSRIPRSEEHTSELQSRGHLVCCLLL